MELSGENGEITLTIIGGLIFHRRSTAAAVVRHDVMTARLLHQIGLVCRLVFTIAPFWRLVSLAEISSLYL